MDLENDINHFKIACIYIQNSLICIARYEFIYIIVEYSLSVLFDKCQCLTHLIIAI